MSRNKDKYNTYIIENANFTTYIQLKLKLFN